MAREVRLDALAGSPPGTFASTFDEASAWGEAQWRRWAGRRAFFVAEADGAAVGSAGGILDDGPPVLVSVWVNPVARGNGASELLVGAVMAWARDAGHRELRLWVMDGNRPAEALYRRKGFVRTGRQQPCAAGDPRFENEMTVALTPGS